MKESLIADAWLKHYHGDMSDHNIRVTFAAERAWNASARVIIAQMKPFLDAYHEWESQVEPNQSVIINRVLKTYQSHVKPLLKELEEKV